MFLPGNEILPFAGIVNNAIAVAAFLVTGGNIIRMLILVTLFAPAYLWVGTIMAPFISDLARSTGAVALKAGELISCSSIDGPIQTYVFSHVFKIMDGNFFISIMCDLCCMLCCTFTNTLKKKKQKEERSTRLILNYT